MSETLEGRIENAWCVLRGFRQKTRRTLHLTPRGAIVGFKFSQGRPPGSIEIGTYTRHVTLEQLREDCFFIWDQLSRPKHGRS